MPVEVRDEYQGDIPAIRDLNKRAFEQDQEANIIDALRSNRAVMLSMVAISDGQVVGHIMYSPISIDGKVSGAALGPMAVLPEYQGQGVGSELIKKGNQRLRNDGCPFIIVLGHSEYYARFGFEPASMHEITCEWDVPDNVFMVLILDEAKMRGISGVAKYRPEFSSVE